jgi:hypothetical protein
MKQQRKLDLIAVCVLLIVPLFLFFDVAFLGSGFFLRDLTSYFLPTQATVRDCVEGGEFPYWNPRIAGGQPMAANPDYSVFYPLSWVFAALAFDSAFQWTLLLHIALALAGMYVFLRSLELTIAASVVGAVSFGFGGFYLSYLTLGPFLYGLTWLPLVLASTRRALLSRSAADTVLAGLVWGVQLLAGEPGVIAQTGFIICSCAVWHWWTGLRTGSEALKALGILCAIAIAALLVGAVQILAAIDLVGDSIRSRGLAFHVVSAWSMPPARALEMFFPHLFGEIDPSIGPYWAANLYGERAGSPYVTSLYVGLPVAVCAVGGLFCRLRGSLLSLFLMATSFAIAVGSHTPLFDLLYRAGLTRSYRYPEKLILMAVITVIVFGSISLDLCLRGDRRVIRAVLVVCGVIAVASLICVVAARTGSYPRLFASLWGDFQASVVGKIALASRRGWDLAALRAAGLLLLFLWIYRNRPSRAWAAALILLTTIDLAGIANEVARRMPAPFFTSPETLASLPPEHKRYRMFHEAYFVDKAFNIRTPSFPGDVRYWNLRNGLFPLISTRWGVQTVLEGDYDASALLPTTDYYESMYLVAGPLGNVPEAFLAMANVGVVARPAKLSSSELDDAAAVRFEEQPRYPRHWFARRLVRVASADHFREIIRSGRWRDGDALVSFEPFDLAPGRVGSVHETFNTIRLKVESSGRGFLVIGATPHKYWTASIDGRRSELWVTNVGFQGLIVPAGSHVVELRYRNVLIARTAPVSALAALGCLALALVGRWLPARVG